MKKIVEGMTAKEVSGVIDHNFGEIVSGKADKAYVDEKLKNIVSGSVSGYKYLTSTDELPTEQTTIGYIIGEDMYLYVGEGGDTLGGLYQNVGPFKGDRGEDGIQGEKGEKGDRGEDGEPGITSATISIDDTTGIPSASVAIENQVLNISLSGLKGEQGNSGYQGAVGELEVVNNLTQGGSTSALSAEMGKQLNGYIEEFSEELYGGISSDSDGSVVITDFPKTDKYYYNLNTRANVSNNLYFIGTLDIPNGVNSIEMRFEKSTGGGIGVEFRDAGGNSVGKFSNTTQAQGTKIKVDIPTGTASIIFSYLNEQGISTTGASAFDGVTLYGISEGKLGLTQRVETLELLSEGLSNEKETYISEDTGNELQDNITLEELYAGYDDLCDRYPDYIKRMDNLGVDASGLEIRQYRIGYNNQFYQVGEGKYPDKSSYNLWDDSKFPYNKILVNAGTHGDEKAPCYATMLAIKDLVESNEKWAMDIKGNSMIYLCPTLNPYGFQNRTLANANGVNINRDIEAQSQPESVAWKNWIDNNADAIAYIDMHGVDYYTPFIEYSKSESADNEILYANIAFSLASGLKSNWDNVFKVRGWARPYLLKSTYVGMTIDYTTSKGIKGFIVETPCDVVSNQYNAAPNYFKSYSKSNKMTKDLLINILGFFIVKNNAGGGVQSNEKLEITDSLTKIVGKQAYGNVGSSISIGNLSETEYIVTDMDGVVVSFLTAPKTSVSSYLQYTDSNGVIVARDFVGLGNNIPCEIKIDYPSGASKVYITGAVGSIKVFYDISFKSLHDEIQENRDRIENLSIPVDKYLIDKTEPIVGLRDVTSEYTINKGKQAYGNVGSAISIVSQRILEYVAIDTDGVFVVFTSEKEKIDVSSYLQYVDANGVILARDFVSIGVGVECKKVIQFPPNATRAYVTGSIGTIQIFEYVNGFVSQFEAVRSKVEIIPEVGKLEDITVADNPKSIVDAINKACTLSIIRNTTVLNKEDAFEMWGQSSASNYFLKGEVGSKIAVLDGQDVRNMKIPVKDGDMITYPMFKTSQTNGSFLVDSNNIILEAFINNTEPNGTMNTVTVSGYGDKEVFFYLSLYPYSSVTQKITIKTAEYQTEQIPINEYLSGLLSNDFKNSVSEKKALTTVGASMMYEELSNRMSSGSSILFPCKDYGVMPSCLYGDSEAFLQDGVDAEGNAIIKYSDVIAKYDELVSAYPNYIKKKELGYDASGTIPMYAYTLEPKYPTQSIYLQAGVHGWEPDPVFALAMIATLIANAYGTTDGNGLKVDDDALKYIRENVKITIVPCVNPYGFNNRADCGIDKRGQAQNNANGVQLNGAWTGNAAEAVAVRNLIEGLKHELSFAIDMHSTVWEDSRSRYGCFYGGVNSGSASLLTVFKTYEWLYRFYDMKYPSIVQGDSVPNPFGDGYASIGTMTGTFNSWIYSTYGIESTTMEFSDHVWTPELHTSVAMSVAVNMYLNQFIQHICAGFKSITPKVESSDIYPAKG